MPKPSAQQRAILDALPIIAFTATALGSIDWVSKRWYEISGVDPVETLGEAWVSVVHPDDVETTVWRWTLAIDRAEPFVAMIRSRRADGEYVWLLTRAHRVVDEEDIYWIGTSDEIAEEQLKTIRKSE